MTGTIVVLGAGMAGLTAAYHLMQRGVDVIVLEASHRAGGVVRTERIGGYLVEYGPNSVQPAPDLDHLVGSLGLEPARVMASPVQRTRFVVRRGRPLPLPMGPIAFARSPLFSARAKFRLLREPFVSRGLEGESVADFVTRRAGREFLDYAVDPFVAGVFAGDPGRLSMEHAFPLMWRIEQEHGSLIKGFLARAGSRKRAGKGPGSTTPFTFRDGMQTLPDALAAALGDRLRLTSQVRAAIRSGSSWHIETDDARVNADALISCIPLHRLTEIALEPIHSPLPEIDYVPITVVTLGFRRESVGHPLEGFGILLPESERRFQILGVLFSSSLFSGRAPDGHVLLTCFLGGQRHEDASYLPGADAVKVALADLATLLDIHGEPTFRRSIHIPNAIPQYQLGFAVVLDRLAQIERAFGGLYFSGNYCRGVSVGDTVAHARRRAEDAFEFARTVNSR